MTLNKLLRVNNKPVDLICDHVQLFLSSPGRALFEIATDDEPAGLIELHIGYKTDDLTPYFLGVIESKRKAGDKWYLTCRELVGALAYAAPVSIRFATLRAVLDEYEKLGITFVTPEIDYVTNHVACFYHDGCGISALRQLGSVFGIENFMFQQQANGQVYVGSWNHSNWSDSPVTLPDHVFTYSNANSVELMAVPKLRPGLKLNGNFVTSVILNKSQMAIQWSHRLLNDL